MAYGQKTSNIMDIPLSISSVFAPHVGANGYSWEGMQTIRVLSVANGSLADYNENSATEPFGVPGLVVPDEQVLTLAYNKSMIARIQRTQIQDIPVSAFSKKYALQQADEVFVPAHDQYSLGKLVAARPGGNTVAINLPTDNAQLTEKFNNTVSKARTGGASTSKCVAWVTYSISDKIKAIINYTGSDKGYVDGREGYLGKWNGVKIVEIPDSYVPSGMYAIVADKRAIVNVPPKMDPKNGGLVTIEKVPLFSGIEIQMLSAS